MKEKTTNLPYNPSNLSSNIEAYVNQLKKLSNEIGEILWQTEFIRAMLVDGFQENIFGQN